MHCYMYADTLECVICIFQLTVLGARNSPVSEIQNIDSPGHTKQSSSTSRRSALKTILFTLSLSAEKTPSTGRKMF